MQYEHSTALGSSNLKIWLYLFDYKFWSWWPLCPESCKLIQSASDVPVRGSMATLVATQTQLEHSITLYLFNPRFGLCFFFFFSWSWFPLCLQNCKFLQKCYKYSCQKRWGHLGCKVNVTWAFHNLKIILFDVLVVFIWPCVLVVVPIVPTKLQTCAKRCKYTCQKGWGHLGHNSSATWALHRPRFIHS